MDNKKVEKAIIEVLRRAGHMQIATSSGKVPRSTTVWFSYDSDLNLYFMSRNDRRHSMDIYRNTLVAGSIVDPKYMKPGNAVRGITFQGVAKEAKGKDLEKAYIQYSKRFPIISDRIGLVEMSKGKTALRLFKVVPRCYALFDEVDFVEQPLKELRLRG